MPVLKAAVEKQSCITHYRQVSWKGGGGGWQEHRPVLWSPKVVKVVSTALSHYAACLWLTCSVGTAAVLERPVQLTVVSGINHLFSSWRLQMDTYSIGLWSWWSQVKAWVTLVSAWTVGLLLGDSRCVEYKPYLELSTVPSAQVDSGGKSQPKIAVTLVWIQHSRCLWNWVSVWVFEVLCLLGLCFYLSFCRCWLMGLI